MLIGGVFKGFMEIWFQVSGVGGIEQFGISD